MEGPCAFSFHEDGNITNYGCVQDVEGRFIDSPERVVIVYKVSRGHGRSIFQIHITQYCEGVYGVPACF